MNKFRLVLYIAVFSAIFLFLPSNHYLRAAKCDQWDPGNINESISVTGTTLNISGTIDGGDCSTNCLFGPESMNGQKAVPNPMQVVQYKIDSGSYATLPVSLQTEAAPTTCYRDSDYENIRTPYSYKITSTNITGLSVGSHTLYIKATIETGKTFESSKSFTIPTLSVTLTATPNSGTVPLNNVDLKADVSGTATGPITYKFDCTNDGTWEHTSAATTTDPYTIANLCDYASAGTYTAKVQTTRQGLTATATATVTVSAAPWLTVTLAANPSSGTAPLNDVDLTGNVSGTATGNIVYEFNCNDGDGTWEHTSAAVATDPYTIADICDYASAGTYTARVRATRGGLTANDTVTITVSAAPTLSVTLTAAPGSGTAPLAGVILTADVSGTATGTINYTFYCNRSDAGTNITSPNSYKIDATTIDPYSTPPNACDSIYANSGTYTAKVIAERGSLAAEARATITISAPLTLSVTLSANPSSGTAPLNDVDLTADVSGTATGNIIYKFDCTNNGTWEHTSTATITDPYTIADLCDYPSTGAYTAKVEVNRGGLTAIATATITVNAPTLTCSLSASPSSGTAPLNDADLTGDITGGTATGDIVYKFDCTNNGIWEHTSTATITDPYTIADLCDYPNSGTYTAKLETTRQGVTCSATTTITVNAAPFDFSLSISPSSGSTSPCGSVSTTVNIGLVSGNSQSVSFSASGLPNGATANFSSPSCSPNCNSTLTISTSKTTPVGTYSIAITGTGGGKIHTATYTLAVSSRGLITPTLIVPTHNAWINYDPTFQAKVTDLDLKNVRAHFNLSNNPDGIGNWTTSGTTSQWGPVTLAGTCIEEWWQARTEDICGSLSNWSSWWLVKIDKDLPISSISYPTGLIGSLNFIVRLGETENCSGISLGDVDVSTDHGNTWTNQGLFNGGSTTGDFMFTGTAGQCYIFRYRVRDSAGNWSNFAQGGEVCIDTSIPTATIEYPNGWINVNSFNVVLTEDDPGGSIAQGNVDIQSKKASSTNWPIWSDHSDGIDDFAYTGQNCYSYKFRYQVKDNAGNWSNWADPGYITQIDTGSPTVNISYPTGVLNAVVFTVNLSDSDDCSGVAERDLEVSVDSGTWQDYPASIGGITYTGSHNHTYKFRYRARDNANNWSNYVEGGTLELKALPTATPTNVNWTFCPAIALELTWDYSDISGLPQVSFQIQADNNEDFSSPIFDTQEVSASQKSYFVPQNILTQLMTHTKYFWKIRTKNSAGDWSPWDVDYDLSIFFKKLESYSTF